MDEKKRQKLAKKRRKEQAERELQYDLNRDLKIQDQKNETAEIADRYRNKYIDGAITFAGTMVILYIFLFMFRYLFLVFFGPVLGLFRINTILLDVLLHTFVWVASIISVYRGESILERLLNLY